MPESPLENRAWKYFGPFAFAHGNVWRETSEGLEAWACGKRSDGHSFFIRALVKEGAEQEGAMRDALERLKSFLTCACHAKLPCPEHAELMGKHH